MKPNLKQIIILCLLIVCSSTNASGGTTTSKIVAFLTGDSTCADKRADQRPETGWGEMLGLFFESSLAIDNHAVDGLSTKSFINEGRWNKVLEKLRTGDYVFIQFGHNDAYDNPDRHTEIEEFTTNLTRFVSETKAKGAYPILLTSICRRKFDSEGKIQLTFEKYTAATRKVATNNSIPLIDMEQLSKNLLENVGVDKSQELYMSDNTHLRGKGAYALAEIVVEELKKLQIAGLVQEINPNADQSLTMYDGDGTNSKHVWLKNPTTTAQVQAPIANPSPDDVNNTAFCAGFLRQKSDEQYTSATLGNLSIDIAMYDKISFMVYKQITGRVQLEIHDVNGKKYWKNTQDADITPGKWTKLEFSLSDVESNIKTIFIAPHNRSASDDPTWVDQMMYWDELTLHKKLQNSGIIDSEMGERIVSSELYSIQGFHLQSFKQDEEPNVQNKYSQGVYILKQTDDKGHTTSKKLLIK